MKKKRRIILISFFLVAALITCFLVFAFKSEFKVSGFKDTIEVGYKDKFNNNLKVCYGNMFHCEELKPKVKGEVDTNKLGDYEVNYKYTHNKKIYNIKQKVSVVDKEPPVITFEKGTVCPNGKVVNIEFKAVDNIDGDITDKAKVEYKNNKIHITVEDKRGNKEEKDFDAKISDQEAPVIKINGSDVVGISVGSSYEDEGATASDACEGEIEVETDNTVNTSVPGSYKVMYIAKDSKGNIAETERTVNVYDNNNGERVVYLTFDDGPSIYTDRLLDVLKKYNVKATFFVTNSGSDDTIKREYDEGHTVAMHTATHQYSYLYSSVDSYFEDLNGVSSRIERITGVKPTMIRFPGGSSNLISADYDGGIHIMSILTEEVERRGYQYYDWNVSSGDAGGTTTSEGVYNNVVSTLKDGYSIVLQHDIKEFSVDAVESIIQYGLNNGYTFKRLEPSSPKAHHVVFN